jgi:Rrf2 family protein
MKSNGRFGMSVHILTVLAYKAGDRVSSEFLAASVNTHPVIVRRLLLALQQAKLVETRKGAGLGSRLSRSPARINLAEVYRAVNPHSPLALPCRTPNLHCPVGRRISSVLTRVFASAQEALERDLARVTLASILEAIEKGQSSEDTFTPRPRGKQLRLSFSKLPR